MAESHNKSVAAKKLWTDEKRKEMSIKQSGKNNPMYGKNIKDYMTEEAYENWKLGIKNTLNNKTEEEKNEVSRKLREI